MSKIAYLFPGQGSQFVGMAKDIYESSDKAKEIIDSANDALGFDLSGIMFEGPIDSLKQTDVTQPAIFLHSILIFNLLKEKNFDATAGHSLGEYSSLVAAGALDFVDALKLVRFRGQSMLQAGVEQPGTMAAVIGLIPEKVEEICKEASEAGIVQCANFNSPGQIVISGSVDGVRKAMELSKIVGAKMVKELVVSGAFHSPLMQSAKDKFKQKLDNAEIKNAIKHVYANVTAKPVSGKNEIGNLLFEQLTSPVRWEETIKNMIEEGITEFVEIGPGKVLQGLVKRIDRDVKISGLEKYSDLEGLI
ncbi:MAG: ACP S-malonyltransferase [Ignavibacteria bacterium]|jgi:[acyl-carrier-protein] S-malonyltransferase